MTTDPKADAHLVLVKHNGHVFFSHIPFTGYSQKELDRILVTMEGQLSLSHIAVRDK